MQLNLLKSFLAVATCALVAVPSVSRAGLGADVSSVEADRAQLKATVHVLAAPRYSVHELQVPGGTVVREFVGSSGSVFAVTWRGPFMPDLRQMLGAHFDSYQSAVRVNRTGHARVSVLRPDLVVHSGGHQRAFFGQAYLPQALPAGVTNDELR